MIPKRILAGSKELYNSIVSYIQNWCNGRFSLTSHKHDYTQIVNAPVSGMAAPNYSKAVKINSNPRNMSYTAPSNGYLMIHAYCAQANANYGSIVVTIESMAFCILHGYGNYGAKSSNACLPMMKGQKATCSGWAEGGEAWFIPCY